MYCVTTLYNAVFNNVIFHKISFTYKTKKDEIRYFSKIQNAYFLLIFCLMKVNRQPTWWNFYNCLSWQKRALTFDTFNALVVFLQISNHHQRFYLQLSINWSFYRTKLWFLRLYSIIKDMEHINWSILHL